jgi:hypothetical protein
VERIFAALGFYAWMGKALWAHMLVFWGILGGIKLVVMALEWIEVKLHNKR